MYMRSRLLVQRLQRMREYAGYAAVTGNLSSLSLSRRSASVLCQYLADAKHRRQVKEDRPRLAAAVLSAFIRSRTDVARTSAILLNSADTDHCSGPNRAIGPLCECVRRCVRTIILKLRDR